MTKQYSLIETVIENSEYNNWEAAVMEWEIYDVEEDSKLESTCICGKENIKYLFSILNQNNGKILKPIGSNCIKKFERTEMNKQVNIHEKLFKLLHAMKNGEFIELNSDYFSKNLLKYLFEEGCFQDSQYNTAEEGYEFMLKMFNMRKEPSDGQGRKTRAIIMNDIRPYLEKRLAGKIK